MNLQDAALLSGRYLRDTNNLMEMLIPAITEGLGSPTQEAGWYTECETQYRTIYWGALFVDFTRSELVEPKVVRWGILNSFHVINKTFSQYCSFS